jgi:phosphoenolpyruvate-protein kinase (PTS system EI component)
MNAYPRTCRLSLATATILAGACFLGSVTISAQEGVKETEQFIKAGNNLSEAVAEAKQQVQATLGNYNDLLSLSATDMKDGYKKLLKNIKQMNEKTETARTRVTEMRATGDVYFAGRAATIKKIQDPALQGQAQQRLDASQQSFAGVLGSLREARDSFDPLRKELADHVKYLESDLSPSGTASLKPQAEQAKASAAVVFAKADDAIRTANTYFTGLRAR